MSTTLFMGRMPQRESRRRIHSGDGATLTSVTTRALYLGQRALSVTVMVTRSPIGGPSSRMGTSGYTTFSPVMEASSRATPRTLRQSPRFGVISTSRSQSERPRASASGWPSVVSAGRIMIPADSSASFSSCSEQSIPSELRPRIFAFLISTPLGSTAPIFASATTSPAAMFLAPQTMSNSAAPSVTRQRERRSAPGCWLFSRIFAVTTFSNPSPRNRQEDTSTPAMVSASWTCAGERRVSMNSLSQEYGIFKEPVSSPPRS